MLSRVRQMLSRWKEIRGTCRASRLRKGAGAAVRLAALLLTLGAAFLPASQRELPYEAVEERFGPIHFYTEIPEETAPRQSA